MVQANELRIGNYFFRSIHSFCGKSSVVTKVRDMPYLIYDNKEGYLMNEVWADEYEPTPLTTEILVKCGFKTNNRFAYKIKLSSDTSLELDSDGEFFNVFLRQENSEEHIDTVYLGVLELKFLHQLQNLYFALTGEELTVNFSTP
jgi:hypothetical protein